MAKNKIVFSITTAYTEPETHRGNVIRPMTGANITFVLTQQKDLIFPTLQVQLLGQEQLVYVERNSATLPLQFSQLDGESLRVEVTLELDPTTCEVIYRLMVDAQINGDSWAFDFAYPSFDIPEAIGKQIFTF